MSSGPLVLEDRGDDDEGRSGRRGRSQPIPARLCAPSQSSSGRRRDARGGPVARHRRRRDDRPDARGRLRRRPRRARGSERRDDDHGRRPSSAPATPIPARRARPRAGVDHRELLGRDLLARRAEHVRVLERTFVSTTTRVSRTFVASCRPPSPASTTATSTPAAANSASAAAVNVSNCVAPRRSANGRTRPIACSKSASPPPTRIRSAQPARAERGTRRRAAPHRRAALRSSASSSTCRSYRRRGRRDTRSCGSPSSASSARDPLEPEAFGRPRAQSPRRTAQLRMASSSRR